MVFNQMTSLNDRDMKQPLGNTIFSCVCVCVREKNKSHFTFSNFGEGGGSGIQLANLKG